MSDFIELSSTLKVPLDIVTQRTAILAKTGAGKSNTAKVIVEGALAHGAQVVILDPVGHWWGLRTLFPVPVLGGMSGDVPLDPLSGKLIARVAVDSGQSLVIDCSSMDSDGEMQRFAKDFAKTLYDLKQAHPTAMLLVIEEADEFAPQDTRGEGVPQMVGAFARIAKRGRGRGMGLLSVTLRSAALSKNVLNQTDNLVAMRTTAPLDIEAIAGWLKYVRLAGADTVLSTLPGLETGSAWMISPEAGVLAQIKVVKAKSLDTSATPKVGDIPPAMSKKLKPIDLDALGEQMSAMADKAKADDPAALRKEIADLRRLLAARPSVPVEVEVPVELRVEVPVVSPRVVEYLESLAGGLMGSVEQIRGMLEEMEEITKVVAAPAPKPRGPLPETADPRGRGATRPLPVEAEQNGSLTGPQHRILDALAWWDAVGVCDPSLSQVGFVAGYHPRSKGFTNALSSLSSSGMIERVTGAARLTAEGDRSARHPAGPVDDEALQELIYAQIKPAPARMLRELIGLGREATVDELATRLDYHPRSKGFTNMLSSLSGLGLVERGRGTARASTLCFVR